jgi:hypothetical protein
MKLQKIEKSRIEKKAQVTIFIIIAIVIVGAIVAYFALRNMPITKEDKIMKPVHDYYLSCLQQKAKEGIGILGEQGGYITLPDFVEGSQYRPFSSQLNFLGTPVAYWMYVSGNNLLKEQLPTKSSMEEELKKYIEDGISDCDFSDFYQQGYDVSVGDGEVSVNIQDESVFVQAKNNLRISFGNDSVLISKHNTEVKSRLGRFYDLAFNTYNKEKEEMFLEKYAIDVMRLYVPVTGVEVSCAPKVFVDEEIQRVLMQGLEANIGNLKLKGNYYTLNQEENKYFVTPIDENLNSGENANFIYSSTWPTRIEIFGDKTVEPVGMQEGLGMLGFCYVPYHLVYDINFPVLIQFYDNEDLFQFAISVIVEKSKERQALPSAKGESVESQVCQYKNKEIQVYTYDSELNPVEADISFSCLNTECRIGKTEIKGRDAILDEKFPECVNGFISARAKGYSDSKYQISTNEEEVANILMKKLYNLTLKANVEEGEQMLITFYSEDYSTSVLYPDNEFLELPEGEFNVTSYIFKNSSITIPATNTQKCIDVPQSGIGGLFGFSQKKCIDLNIPEQEMGFVIIGGGKSYEYFAESQLKNGFIRIQADKFPVPNSLQGVQDNYIKLEESLLNIKFE